ncbi:MAG: hypothetical protein HY674_22540 [Chloroflexi bacterium]|nr:hypothetical protein [Chloroflexota bacterium]
MNAPLLFRLSIRLSLSVAAVGVGLFLAAPLATGEAAAQTSKPPKPPLQPVVEVEEDVYRYESADNGAGPLWCGGSTCLVRIGNDVFASGLETLKDFKPLNNCRWTLFKCGADGWEQQQADPAGRTREPSPLAAFPDGRLFLSANPTLTTAPDAYSGPARPEILQFKAADIKAPFERILPAWDGSPPFTEHSYRSFAADGPGRELILFQNIGYTHAEWTFRDQAGQWLAQGKLKWPWGAEYDQPQPIRVCYPNVALKNRAVHICGVSDIVEPYKQWRAYKKQLTGRDWDYDFRRLFYTWIADITTGQFQPWVEIASRDKTCGWVSPGDLWVGPDGAAHILWTDRALDERLREQFFPGEKQSHTLNYAVVRDGKVVLRRTLLEAREGGPQEIPGRARFQITPENRLLVFVYVSGKNAAGEPVSENRLLELYADGSSSAPVRVPLKHPMGDYFTATVRGGSPPSRTLELLGHRVGSSLTVSFARIKVY